MSNIISFLENVGRDAALRHASREQLLDAMRHADVSPALLDQGKSTAGSLVDVRETMYCSNEVVPAPKKFSIKRGKKHSSVRH